MNNPAPDPATSIFPTHKCFDDALEFLEAIAKQNNPIIHRLRLAHGICIHPDGHPYAHAWVEQDTDYVIFAGILNGQHQYFAASRAEYYADSKVYEVTLYTPKEAWRENVKSGTYGPWLARYQSLCQKGSTAKAEREGL